MSVFQKSLVLVTGLGLCVLGYWLTPILTPFLVGGLLAYLGNPLVNYLMKWKLPRLVAVIGVFMLMFGVVLCLVILLIPLLENQIIMSIGKLPEFIHWIQDTVIPWLSTHFDINIKTAILSGWQQAGQVADKVLKTITHSSMALFAILINIVLIPVVMFYLLRDWPALVKKTRDLIPRKYLPMLSEILTESNEVLGLFFRGQLVVMLALGIIYSTGLAIIGLNLSLLIGVVIAVLSIVPYLGTMIGLGLAIIAALFQFQALAFMPVVYIIILFIVGHILEGMVLTPLLIGDRIGLHPVAVIFAILAGGQLFGFFGVLLALPIAALIMVWVRYIHRHYLNSRFYR